MLPNPLLETLFGTDTDTDGEAGKTLRHTSFAQPALFAVEVGLARLWQSWAIEPDVLLGHSVGQYAAACVAGVFSLEDGARLVAERGRLFGNLPEGGRMVAVFADPQHAENVADGFPRVSVAAYNGPNTVLSGPAADLEQIVGACSDDGIRCTWLDTSHAFHSELARTGARRIRILRSAAPIRRPDSAAGLQPHRRRPDSGNPTERTILAAAFPPAGAIRRKRPHRGAAGMLGIDGDRPATDSDLHRAAGLAGILARAAPDRFPAQGRRCAASDRRSVGRDVCRRASTRVRCAATSTSAADSNCPRTPSSAVAIGPRLPASVPTVQPYPESSVAQRISLPAIWSTPAGGRSNRSRGCQITSSTAPSSFRARRTRRWPLPRLGYRRRCAMSSFMSRSSWATRIPARCS